MRTRFLIFFTFLMGLSFAAVKGDDKLVDGTSELKMLSDESCSEHFLPGVWVRFQDAFGVYLLHKLGELVKEHPIESMVLAIAIGVITKKSKDKIIAGIKKLGNSAYRVIGFGRKTDEENKKDEQKKEIKFVEWADLNNDNISGSDKIFVLDS